MHSCIIHAGEVGTYVLIHTTERSNVGLARVEGSYTRAVGIFTIPHFLHPVVSQEQGAKKRTRIFNLNFFFSSFLLFFLCRFLSLNFLVVVKPLLSGQACQ